MSVPRFFRFTLDEPLQHVYCGRVYLLSQQIGESRQDLITCRIALLVVCLACRSCTYWSCTLEGRGSLLCLKQNVSYRILTLTSASSHNKYLSHADQGVTPAWSDFVGWQLHASSRVQVIINYCVKHTCFSVLASCTFFIKCSGVLRWFFSFCEK